MEGRRGRTGKAARESEAFLDAILEQLPNMVFVKDAEELRFVRLNRKAEDILGSSRDELLGKNDYDFFAVEQADFFTRRDREVLARAEIGADIVAEGIETAAELQTLLALGIGHGHGFHIARPSRDPLDVLGPRPARRLGASA
jgi:PAS domain-containing protein